MFLVMLACARFSISLLSLSLLHSMQVMFLNPQEKDVFGPLLQLANSGAASQEADNGSKRRGQQGGRVATVHNGRNQAVRNLHGVI